MKNNKVFLFIFIGGLFFIFNFAFFIKFSNAQVCPGGLWWTSTTSWPATRTIPMTSSTINYLQESPMYVLGSNVRARGDICTDINGKCLSTVVGGGGDSYWVFSNGNLYTTSTVWRVGIGTTTPNGLFQVYNYISFETSSRRTKIGYLAGDADRRGLNNTWIGDNAGAATVTSPTSSNNTGIGYKALYNNRGDSNTAVGSLSLASTTNGRANTAVGDRSLVNNVTGIRNTAIGASALFNNRIGNDNIAIGYMAAKSLISGSNNIIIGNNADVISSSSSNFLNIVGAIYGNLSSGNIGIGTATPSYKLHVAGRIQATGDICTDLNGGKCLSTVGGGGDSYWVFSNGNLYTTSTVLRVGIGTTNPGAINGLPAPEVLLNVRKASGLALVNIEGEGVRLRLADNSAKPDNKLFMIQNRGNKTIFAPTYDNGVLKWPSLVIDHTNGTVSIGSTTNPNPVAYALYVGRGNFGDPNLKGGIYSNGYIVSELGFKGDIDPRYIGPGVFGAEFPAFDATPGRFTGEYVFPRKVGIVPQDVTNWIKMIGGDYSLYAFSGIYASGTIMADKFCISTTTNCITSWPGGGAGGGGISGLGQANNVALWSGTNSLTKSNIYQATTTGGYINIGIGVVNPKYTLDVGGDTRVAGKVITSGGSAGFCIGNDCITSWADTKQKEIQIATFTVTAASSTASGDCRTGCTASTSLGIWDFCALTRTESKIYDNTVDHRDDSNYCDVSKPAGSSWKLTAYANGGGDGGNIVYTKCVATCMNFKFK
jgi:hypothetical protein